jgi:hypothetical protein
MATSKKPPSKSDKSETQSEIQRAVDIDPIWQRFISASQGHFEALVRLKGNYQPDYMNILGPFSEGVLKVELPSSALARLSSDEKVLSVEVREYVVA